MFDKIISDTPFSNDAADVCFKNITGDAFRYDVTFLSTLRALLLPRMQNDEFVELVFGSSNMTPEYVESNDAKDVVRKICSRYSLYAHGQFIIHNFDSYRKAGNMACLKSVESAFTSVCIGYHRLDKIRAFYRKSFMVDCYINPELKSTIVFVEDMNVKKMHYLQVSVMAMLPWYIDREKGMTDDEMALICSLKEKSPDMYLQCLSKLAEKYDFRSVRIRQMLFGFESRNDRRKTNIIRSEIADIDTKINEYNREIGAFIRQRDEKCIMLMGLETKLAGDEDGDSEIMEYFLRNPNLVLKNVNDLDLYFCAKGYLEYFDPDMAEGAIRNKRSYAYQYGYASKAQNASRVERLLSELFLEDDPKLRIRFCAAYSFNINNGVCAMRNYNFGKELAGYMPNPHIDRFACMGDYIRVINNLMIRNDYIGVLEQCIASCKSLNFGDSPVMDEFMKIFWSDSNKARCIELPDGKVVNAEEAISWLEEQDKNTETGDVNVEETKEEAQNE